MKNRMRLFAWLMVVGIGLANLAGVVRGQVVERDTKITGPRGRSIERKVEVQRRPGMVDRQVQITRPGGTIDRQVQVQRSPVMGRRFVPGPWGRAPWIGPRPLVLAQPIVPALGFGMVAAPFMNFSFGGGGFGGGMGGGMGGMPGAPMGQRGQPAAPPDQVALMCQRLQGFGVTARKDAAYDLGRMGDPRAVPSLVHVLKYDNFKDVRVAAAIALGEIGGSAAAVALERSAIYDHREDVRKAATTAIERLNARTEAAATAARSQPTAEATASTPVPTPPAAQPPPAETPSPFRESTGTTGSASGSDNAVPELTPPPPPTPVTSGAGPRSKLLNGGSDHDRAGAYDPGRSSFPGSGQDDDHQNQ